MDQICVESEDLCGTLRYDPPLPLTILKAIVKGTTADSGRMRVFASASTMMNSFQRLFSYRFCSSGVRRVTYALATVSCPFAG
jgi:hypothetical protein